MTARITNLTWHGSETVEAATTALGRAIDVQLHLPANFHHAVVERLRVSQAPSTVEAIDVTGGAELLARVGGIAGLEHVAALAEPAQQVHAEVRVVSPAPIVAIHCRDSTVAHVE
jgi:hypothetical protein